MQVRKHIVAHQHKSHVRYHNALFPGSFGTSVFVIVGWDGLAKLQKSVTVLGGTVCALQYVTLLFIGGISATSLRGFLRTTRKVMVSDYLLKASRAKSMHDKAQQS